MNCNSFNHIVENDNGEKLDLYLATTPTLKEYTIVFEDGSSIYTELIRGRYQIKRNGIDEGMYTSKIISWKELVKGFKGINENEYNEIIINCKKVGDPIDFSKKRIQIKIKL